MSSITDSGMGLVLSMVHFNHSIEQQKQVYNCKANDVGVMYKEQIAKTCLQMVVNNCLHGKKGNYA